MAECPTTAMWADRSVPHKGWKPSFCEIDRDLAPFMICQMCGSDATAAEALESYEHRDYPMLVAAGPCCSSFMESGPDWEDLPAVVADPAPIAPPIDGVRARVAAGWDQVTWKQTRFEIVPTYVADVEGLTVSIFDVTRYKQGGFKIQVYRRASFEERLGKKVFATLEEAKQGAIEAVVWGLKNMTRKPKNLLSRPATLLHDAIDHTSS